MSEEKTTLKYSNYTIEITETGFGVFAEETGSQEKEWVCTAADPQVAMSIIEGLVLLEHKRFHYPDSEPTFQSGNDKPLPPFLRKASQNS